MQNKKGDSSAFPDTEVFTIAGIDPGVCILDA